MRQRGNWQLGSWAGFVCVLLAANGLAHDATPQAVLFFGAALLFFLWAAWLGRTPH